MASVSRRCEGCGHETYEPSQSVRKTHDEVFPTLPIVRPVSRVLTNELHRAVTYFEFRPIKKLYPSQVAVPPGEMMLAVSRPDAAEDPNAF